MTKRIIRALHTWRATAKTVEQLSRLSDDQLRDIGLSRADIASIGTRVHTA